MTQLKPRQPVPALSVDTVGGDRWTLSERRPKIFAMLVFYRGLHCPVCKTYLRDLDRKADAFAERGTEVAAISADDRDRAARSATEWGLERLTVGYGLPIAEARDWGLYVSRGIKQGEPAEFSEPGLFLVRPDGTLYAAMIATMPFARPDFDDLLTAIDFIVAKDYPARGEA